MHKLLSFLALIIIHVSAYSAATDQTPTAIVLAGVADTTSAASAEGNTFTNTGYEFVEIINADASPTTVTIDAYPSGGQGAPEGLTVTDPTVVVSAGTRKRFGPFRKRIFNNGSEKVTLTFSNTTSVTVAVYSLSPSP